MRTYKTCALEATCAYEYGFARKATYCVHIRLVHTSTDLRVKRLIAYVYDLCDQANCAYEYGFARKATYYSSYVLTRRRVDDSRWMLDDSSTL